MFLGDMIMNFNLYDEYRFTQGKLISTQSGKKYEFNLDRQDRFYTYLKPHITNGKVTGLTKLMIDTLAVKDTDKSFWDENTFSLNTIILARDNSGVYYSYEISIKNIKINRIDVSKLSYENESWICTLCEMEIPYQTNIDIVERA